MALDLVDELAAPVDAFATERVPGPAAPAEPCPAATAPRR
jgi:hypothetical protein